MILPALSVKQPWASWIADGNKTIETRTKATDWRGPILIVSPHKPDPRFERAETTPLPLGKALAVTLLARCRLMTRADEQAARCEIYDDAVAWCFKGLWPVTPFHVTGRLGLYDQYLQPEHLGGRDIYDEVQGYFDRAWAAGYRWRKGQP